MIFRKLSFFIIFIGLMAVFFNYAFVAHAETSPPKPEPRLIYIENISLALAEKAKTMSPEKCQKFPLPDSVCNPKDWETALVPYMIYGEMLSGSPDNQPFTIDLNERPNWLSDYQSDPEFRGHINSALEDAFKKASEAQSKIIKKTVLEYAQTYGYISRPIIKLEELPLYEDKGHKGDLNAIFELRRYYANPEIKNYNPEQTETRYWLFQAIKAGSQEAMLEAGYDRPYAVRTELSHEGTQITLDANCEKIDTSGGEARPACFIYNLIISETPQQTGHVVLDADHLTGQSMSPKELALKKFNGQVVVELVSYADKTPALIRKDYFDLEGRYLGVNAPKFRPNYFWNYKETPLSAPPLIFKETGKAQTLAKEEVRALPYVEAFMFWEEEYPKEERLKAVDDLTLQSNCNTTLEKLRNRRLAKFLLIDPYKGVTRLSPINEQTLDDYLKLATKEYIAAIGLLHEYAASENKPEVYKTMNNLGSARSTSDIYWKTYKGAPYIINKKNVQNQPEKLLLICHAMEAGMEPCYAAQVQVDTKKGLQYHYIINVPPSTYKIFNDPKHHYFKVKAWLTRPWLEKVTDSSSNESYLVLKDYIGGTSAESNREDWFNSSEGYLGSTNAEISSSLVSGYKPVPFHFHNGSMNSDNNFLSENAMSFVDSYYPLWTDLVIEQNVINQKVKGTSHGYLLLPSNAN